VAFVPAYRCRFLPLAIVIFGAEQCARTKSAIAYITHLRTILTVTLYGTRSRPDLECPLDNAIITGNYSAAQVERKAQAISSDIKNWLLV
jgi:hypothetical protein